jgi:hypothetical protein
MDNFDLKNFLIENQLTHNSQQLDEDLKSSVAAVMLLIGSLGAQAQMKPEYQKAITQIQQDYPGRENATIRRTKIDSVANLNRGDIKGKHIKDDQRAINTFLKFKRPDLVNASPEKILKAYTAWSKERSKGDDQPYGDLNTSKDLKRAEKCRTVDGPSFLSKLNPFKEKNGCIYSDEDKSGVKK